jgi:hypothetical protein
MERTMTETGEAMREDYLSGYEIRTSGRNLTMVCLDCGGGVTSAIFATDLQSLLDAANRHEHEMGEPDERERR